jgi:hypothetical protein
MKKVYSISEASMPNLTAGEFFLTLLHSATITHILHLQSTSYAEHKALQKFYEEIVDLTDSLIEAWQGRNETLATYPDTYLGPKLPALDELRGLSNYIDDNRTIVGSESELQNLVDEIQSLVDSTVYKLAFLK